MKKKGNLFFYILICISIVFVSGGFVYKKYKKQKKLKKYICCRPSAKEIDNFSKEDFEYNFSKIVDARFHYNQKLKDNLFGFPFNGYKIYELKKQGRYFIDNENDLIKNYLVHGNIWEEHLDKLMQKYVKENSIVLDIGAHIGTHTINLSKYAKEGGLVIAFEPQPKLFSELFYNVIINNLNNVKLFNAAVGEGVGEIELSPLCPDNEGNTPCEGNSGIIAPLLNIDSLSLENVSLIKIDVEGMEERVLDGAKDTIIKNKPVILIEIIPDINIFDATNEQRKRVAFVYKKLEDMGYIIQNISGHDYIALPY